MPRPCRCRKVGCAITWRRFLPAGEDTPTDVPEIILGHDELEAIRLADLEGLYQEEAARRMNISRQTFGRIMASARHKAAQALVEGKAIRIEGGAVEVCAMRKFQCAQCGHAWEVSHGSGRPTACPACGSATFHRHPEDRGPGGAGGAGRSYGRHGRRCCIRGRSGGPDRA